MPARKFLVDLDLSKNQLQNPVAHKIASDPASPIEGQFYYNTGDESLRLRQSTGWASLASKAYVDAVKQGLDPKDSVRAATESDIADLSTGAPSVVDGVTLEVGDRVLVKSQTDPTTNGIYTVDAVGTGTDGQWSRSIDANTGEKLSAGSYFFVEEGTTHDNAGFVLTTDGDITLGVTDVLFTQFSGAGQIEAGDGLTKDGNTLNVGGTADRISVTADTVDIASTYVGQSSITTLGSITTGTWQGDIVGVAYGGLGNDTFTPNRVIYYNGTNFVSSATLDPSTVTRKYAAVIGDGTATSYNVAHSLGSEDVTVSVYDVATKEDVLVDVSRVDANTVLVEFSTAPAANSYRVVVVG